LNLSNRLFRLAARKKCKYMRVIRTRENQPISHVPFVILVSIHFPILVACEGEGINVLFDEIVKGNVGNHGLAARQLCATYRACVVLLKRYESALPFGGLARVTNLVDDPGAGAACTI